MTSISWIEDDSTQFPSLESALLEPNGLLAAGGNLSPQQLMASYRQGIFPWFEDGQPILWWSPDPRLILKPQQAHCSKSLRKILKRGDFTVTTDQCFREVMLACAEPRVDQDGTWITDEMLDAYEVLHELGHAHSVEVWQEQTLVGGLYGIALGAVFFGESMFSRVSNASKIGFITLMQKLADSGFELVDCQVHTPHLVSLGAYEIPRQRFAQLLVDYVDRHQHWPNFTSTDTPTE